MRSTLFALLFACISAVLVACGGSTNSSASITVAVTPVSASVAVNAQQQFTAKVTGTSNAAVTWSVAGGAANGTISSSGLYTAPASIPNPAQVTVTATSQASSSHSGSATVTVTTASSSGGVSVTPASASLVNFGTQQFSAAINGASTNAVNWEVNGTAGGTQQFGFISTTGFYVAPAGAPTKSDGSGGSTTNGATITITAISQANASQSGTATVTITPGNQNAQSGAIELGTAGANINDTTTNAAAHTITCCSGTLGSLVTRGGSQFILSNTHVLARSDAAAIGEAIIQPASCPPSGGRTVANLSAFYNLETGAAPKIDAAIAAISSSNVDTSGNILYLGATADASGVPVPGSPHAGSGVPASIGMNVAKSGAATGLTCSSVLATAVATTVTYERTCTSSTSTSNTFKITFANQVDIAGGSFSGEGDSGSLVVSQSTADPVALLFAGSDTDTVGNPVGTILNFFASGGNAMSFVGSGTHAVVGCTLPAKPASASSQSAVSVSPESMQRAVAARDAHAPELLAHPEVQAVGVGASRDNPHDSAVLFFVTKGQSRSNIPAQVDGVRTRIIEGELFSHRGTLNAEQSAELERSAPEPSLVYPISPTEFARAKQVHAAHTEEQLSQPGVQGIGITSSVDAPGEAALMIFVVRGAARNPIPPVIDGVRTRIRESSPFRAGLRDRGAAACKVPVPSLKSLLRR